MNSISIKRENLVRELHNLFAENQTCKLSGEEIVEGEQVIEFQIFDEDLILGDKEPYSPDWENLDDVRWANIIIGKILMIDELFKIK